MPYQWSEVVFFIGFVVYIAIRHRYIERAKKVERVRRQIDGCERALFGIVLVGNLLLPMIYLFTPLLRFADYALPTVAPWFGAPLMAAALWLFWRSHVGLGDNWSVSLEIRKDHELITHGVYRRIRHPMYAAILLFGLAQALLLPNWLAGWSALVSFAVLYVVRCPREERMMLDTFGSAYQEYARRTGRIFPRLVP